MNMNSVTTNRTASDPSLGEHQNRPRSRRGPPPRRRSAASIAAALLLGFSATVVSAQPDIRILYQQETISAADVFDLGEVRLYEEEHVQFFIYNLGDASLEFIGTPRVEIVELSEGDKADFRAELDTPEVAPGGLALLDLWFTPSSRGDRQIEITVHSNDTEHPDYAFTLWTSGVAPLINVSSEQVTIQDGETLDIGEVWMGEVLEVELAIENLGNAPLMLAGDPQHIEINEFSDGSSDDFAVILQAVLIAPGASAPLLIVLDPASAGKRVVELVIPSNDPDHAQYVFHLEVLVHQAEGDEDSDCNSNAVADSIDVASHESEDCDGNGVPDECQEDSDSDGVIDACEEDPAPPGDDPQEDPDGDGDGDGDGGSDDPGDGIGDGGGSDENQDPPQGQDDSDDESPGGGVDDPDGGGSRNRGFFGFCGAGGLGMMPMMMLGLMGMRYRRGR